MDKVETFFIGAIFGVILTTVAFGYTGAFYKPTPISERITACEEKGGKYHYNWNDMSNGYYERCDVIEKEIKDF